MVLILIHSYQSCLVHFIRDLPLPNCNQFVGQRNAFNKYRNTSTNNHQLKMRQSAWRELSPFLRQFVIGCVNDIMIITVILNENIVYCKSGNLFIK